MKKNNGRSPSKDCNRYYAPKRNPFDKSIISQRRPLFKKNLQKIKPFTGRKRYQYEK